jgi:hypothetical protein
MDGQGGVNLGHVPRLLDVLALVEELYDILIHDYYLFCSSVLFRSFMGVKNYGKCASGTRCNNLCARIEYG